MCATVTIRCALGWYCCAYYRTSKYQVSRSSKLLLWCSQQKYTVVADSVNVQSAIRPRYTSAERQQRCKSKTRQDQTRQGKPPIPHLCRLDRSHYVYVAETCVAGVVDDGKFFARGLSPLLAMLNGRVEPEERMAALPEPLPLRPQCSGLRRYR